MKQLFALSAVMLGTLGATPVQSATIYSQTQPDEPTGAYSSEDKPITGQKIAGSFLLQGAGPIPVRSLRLIGGYGLTAPPPQTPTLGTLPPDNFRIAFLEDINVSPGGLVAGGDFKSAEVVSRNPTGGALLNGVYHPIEYEINLSDTIMLSPSVPYWLSITNTLEDDFFWVWARADGTAGNLLASTFNSIDSESWQVANGSMWYELNTLPVPEPSTLLMLPIALALLESIRSPHTYRT